MTGSNTSCRLSKLVDSEDTHAPWEVDGGYSFDLRPAVSTIMRAENWLLERMKPGQILFVIMGEIHNDHVDALLQQAVLQAHTEQAKSQTDRTFSLGIEFPHNFLLERTGRSDADPDCIEGMNAFIKNPKGSSNPEAVCALFHQCIRDKISVSFNDLACKANGNLDLDDPYTAELIEQNRHLLKGSKPEAISSDRERQGPAFRNLSMFERSVAHAEATASKIHLINTGSFHVAGSASDSWWYSDSLSKLFLQSGHAVLPVISGYESWEYKLSREAREMMNQNGVRISCLERAYAPYGNQGDYKIMAYEEARAKVNSQSCFDI